MKKLSKQFIRLPLATAVTGALMAQVAWANAPTTDLGSMTVNVDARQGAKVRTNVVTTQTKDESTATGLRELLQGEPAIDFSGGNGTSSYLTIRGMGQNVVDVKVDNAYSDSQILYHQGRHMLDPSLVKIVAVQKGAGSASAGIGATNGAIVAKTVDALDLLENSDKDWGLKLNAGYSSNAEHSYGVTGFGKAGDFDFLVSYNEVSQDNYKPGDGAVRRHSKELTATKYSSPYTVANPNHPADEVAFQAMDKESYLVKLGYAPTDNHRFVLSHFNTTNKGVRNVREEFDWFAGNNGFYRELSLSNTNLEYQGNLGVLGKAEANVYMMKNERESANDVGNGYARHASGLNSTSVKTTGANLGFDKYVNDDVLFKYGVNYRHQETSPHMVSSTNRLQTTEKDDIGVYGEVIGTIGDFTLTGGLRYDMFDYTSLTGRNVSDGALSPSVGVIWQATPSLSFNAVHNHATRSPRLIDALLTSNSSADIAPGTKSEQARNTEIGFNYDNGTLSVDGTYFWQNIDNLLADGQNARLAIPSPGHTGPAPTAAIANVGHGKNHGFELNARYRINGWTARLGVAEANPEFYAYNGVGGQISMANRQFGSTIGRTWTAGLAYRFDNPDLEIGVNHRMVDDVKGQSASMTATSLFENSTRGLGGSNDPNLIKYGYNVTDIYANWKPFHNDRMNVNFSVNNVTDEYYYSHSAITGLPGVGREYRVGINYQF